MKIDIRPKIFADFESFEPILKKWKSKGETIVFTNGCFDILHRGHVQYLAQAASYGNFMIVGLNSDKSTKNIKGPSRPVQDEMTRSLILASLFFVNTVVLFDEDTPYNLIQKVKPDILAKGADYKPEEIVGYDIVKAKGGKIVTIDLVHGYSTTNIIGRLKQ